MISLNNITVNFSGKDLLSNISFQINNNNKIGLVGKNGTGKSTLLKIITGEMKNFSGTVSSPKEIVLGYLPQHLIFNEGKSVFEEAFTAFDSYKEQAEHLEKLNEQLSERTDYESKEFKKLVDQISDLSYKLSFQNESQFLSDTEKVLKGLGFLQEDFNRQADEFSGGWRMRIEIAKILLSQPDILLLDEPTNHLDINSIQWVENFLLTFKGALLVISHDRRFLDNITTRTIEISMGQIYDYNASYSKYKAMSTERREQQISAYKNQQNIIRQTERFIERFRAKSTKATQVQSRIKMLEKMEKIEIDTIDTSNIKFFFPPAPRAADIVVETIDLGKNFGTVNVLNNVNFVLERGEKVAFVGKNGQGKTTLARIINQELEFTGKLKLCQNIAIGYYAQNQDETLDKQKTVFETLDDIAVGEIRTQLKKILGSFLFRNDDIDKKVAILSGGERARLALAKLILQPYNLLILDEPTNHLDIPAKDILKKALQKYNGTLIIASHDRDFLDGLVETVYEFTDKNIKQYRGDINYFLEKKKIAFIDEISVNTEKLQKRKKTKDNTKNEYLKRKEQKRIINNIEKQIAKIENDIENMESRITKIEENFSNPKNKEINEQYEEYEELKKEHTLKMEEWENQHKKLSDFKDNL